MGRSFATPAHAVIYQYEDYRNYLRAELVRRISANPRYSLRSFAKFLGLSGPGLSQVISGKKNLSHKMAHQIASRLELDPKEIDYLLLLVQFKTCKDPDVRSILLEKMRVLSPKREVQDLSTAMFKVISDWYHYPILMLTEVKDFNLTPETISQSLGISIFEARMAIERLLKLKLLEIDPKTSRYRRTLGDVQVQSEKPNEGIRRYHKQLLKKAISAVDEQDPSERFIGTEIVAISEDKLSKANALLNEYLDKIALLTKSGNLNSMVYCFSVQGFRLTKDLP